VSLRGRRMPWRDGRFVVVDLELTGLNPRRDEIVSFGAVPVDGGRVLVQDAVYGLVRPSGSVPSRSVLVHGIRDPDLVDAPEASVALVELVHAMAGRVLVAHAAEIERAFLRRALRGLGLRLRGPVIDTRALAQLWLTERDGALSRLTSLDELARGLGLPVHRPHNALGDALTTAQLFIAAATHLDAQRPETVGSLSRVGDRLENLRLYPRMHC
jgi:DNA polymerase-3 subunit epsilon